MNPTSNYEKVVRFRSYVVTGATSFFWRCLHFITAWLFVSIPHVLAGPNSTLFHSDQQKHSGIYSTILNAVVPDENSTVFFSSGSRSTAQ